MIDEDGYFDPDAERQEHADTMARDEARLKERGSAIESIIYSPSGRQFLWELLSTCGVWSASYGEHMAFREGQRDIGIRVMREIEALRPGILHQMSSENQSRESRYKLIVAPQPKE